MLPWAKPVEMSFAELWNLWSAGQDLSHRTIFGLQICWWTRIGNFLQFASAFVLVIELVGVDRLRTFGSSLHSDLGLEAARRRRRDHVRWLASMRTFWRTDDDDTREERALDRSEKYRIDTGHLFLFLLLGACSIYILWGHWWILAAALIVLLVAYPWVLPRVTFAAALAWDGVGLLVDRGFVAPTIWILELRAFERIAKLGSLLVLALGTMLAALGW